MPLEAAAGDFGPDAAGIFVADLTVMDGTTVAGLNAGANANDNIYLRYFIDGAAGGNDTTIYIWGTGNAAGTNTVNIYNDDQAFFSINLRLDNSELNIVNAENNDNVQNRPSEMLDGFILWNVPAAAGDVVSWSVVSSAAFGAKQTVMNPIRKLDAAGRNVFRVKVIQDAAGTIPAHSLEVD